MITITTALLAFIIQTAKADTLPIVAPTTEYILSLPASEQREIIKSVISRYAKEYDVSQDYMNKLMDCESKGDIKAHNKKDPNGGSRGLFQFQDTTFDDWSKELCKKKGQCKERNIIDVYDQVELTAYGISKGRESSWYNCMKIIQSSR